MDVVGSRETTIRSAGGRLRKSRAATTQSAAQPAIAARYRHGMAAAAHRTTLIAARGATSGRPAGPSKRRNPASFRRGTHFHPFGLHGAELELRDLAERVERRIGQE